LMLYNLCNRNTSIK